MLTNITRNFFILIVAIYSFYKLLNLNSLTKKTSRVLVFSSLIISFISSFLFISNLTLNWFCILLLFFILMKISTKQRTSTIYVTTLFSFALSFIAFNIAGLIIAFILVPFRYGNYVLPWVLVQICVGLLQFLLLYCCFRIPRLKKGMTFLYNTSPINVGSCFCLFTIMLFVMYGYLKTYDEKTQLSICSILCLLGFLLIYWWNYHITQTYRKYLKENEINALNLLLEEKNREIAKLTADNDRLSRAIHKDNKLIPVLYNSIVESREKKIPLDLSQWEPDSPLGQKLKQLYEERWEILDEQKIENKDLAPTVFEYINATLSFTSSEAQRVGIPFQVMFFDNLESTIPNEITEDDFSHLLSDLMSNAMNACIDTAGSSIQVYLGKTENISTIRIYNTGNVFHMETLKNLGLCRHTTHPETGGSGIGLMDIWMLKEKYKATLLIDEITNESSSEVYTCVNILFNHKNHYIIQSDRHKELSAYLNRPDVMIIPKE